MANSDTVRVVVELVDKFSKDLAELEGRLEKIDGKTLNVDLDIDEGDLAVIEARLQALEDDINTTLDIDVRGYASAKAQKEDLEDDMHSTLHVAVDKDRLRGLGNLNGGEGFNPPGQSKGGTMAGLAGLESLDLADDVFDHTLENIRMFEGSSSDVRISRFTPEEQEFINDWIINPDVARIHNKMPKEERDGWIGPATWAFGAGEKWGPEPTTRKPSKFTPPDIPHMEWLANWFKRDLHGPEDRSEVWENPERFSYDFIGSPTDDKGRRNFADFEIGLRNEIDESLDAALGIKNPAPGSYWTPRDEKNNGRRGFFTRLFNRDRKGGVLAGLRNAVGSVDFDASLPKLNQFKVNEGFDGFLERLKGLVPSMRTWYRLIALVIPLLITLAGAALGAAAALGAIAFAGVAMIGIGLLGYGDSLKESLRNVKKEAKELKEELFEVFRPVAGVFQPFVAQLFDRLPQQAKKLTEPLKGLEEAGYGDFLLGAVDGTADWIARMIDLANELAPEIQAIGAALGVAFGEGIIDLLRWATLELYNNWDAFARLWRILVSVIAILYNVSKAVSIALGVFLPLFYVVELLSEAISNRWVAGLLVAFGAVLMMAGAVFYLTKSLVFLATFWAGSVVSSIAAGIGALYQYITAAYAAVGANAALAASLAAATMGLSLVVGVGAGLYAASKFRTDDGPLGGRNPTSGFGGPSPVGAGMGGGTQINIYGDVGNKEYQRLKDEFPDMYTEQSEIERETEK